MLEEKKDGKVQVLTNRNIREINRKNLMTCIVKEPNITRQELAEKNGISIMTVKHIVDELLDLHIIEERVNQSAVGRKPKALSVKEQFGIFICINFTSINRIRYIAYDLYGKELFAGKEKFEKAKLPLEQRFETAIQRILEEKECFLLELLGVAVMVPGAYYEEADVINYDLIPELQDFHIKQFLKKQFQISNVLVLHDVFPAAYSEYESQRISGDESQFYFYYGNGIGGCFIEEGRALKGENLLAGEVGKMLITAKATGKMCTLEEATSIDSLVLKLASEADFDEIIEQYKIGNKEVYNVINTAVEDVAQAIYNTVWILNPTRVVVDSYYPKMRELIAEKLKEFFENHMYGSIVLQTEVFVAKQDEFHKMEGCFNLTREEWIDNMSKDRG